MRDRALLDAFAAALEAPRVAQAQVAVFAGDAALARRRLRLYRGNVEASVAKALSNAYPVVRQLVGDEFFDALGREFARAHPSASGDLNELGASFAAFLDGFPHVADLRYLPDVARLEWLVHRAHYAADAAAFDLSRLAGMAPERFAALVPRLHPACALVASRHPVATIWRVHQPGHAGGIAVDLDAGGERALVRRPRWKVEVDALAPGAHAFLSAVHAARPLGVALGEALAADASFAPDRELSRLVADVVIVDFAAP